MIFNDKEWKAINVNETQLFRIKESRRWLRDVHLEGMKKKVQLIKDTLDDCINTLEDFIGKQKDNARSGNGKTEGGGLP